MTIFQETKVVICIVVGDICRNLKNVECLFVLFFFFFKKIRANTCSIL